jgi:hypothetical protein
MDQCNGSGAVASCTISGSFVYAFTLTNYGNGSTFLPTVSCTQLEVLFDSQFEPYLRANTVAPSWCGLGCRSRTLMVEYINPRFFFLTILDWLVEQIIQHHQHRIDHGWAALAIDGKAAWLPCSCEMMLELSISIAKKN